MQLLISAAGGIKMPSASGWRQLSFSVCAYIIFAIGIPSCTESNVMWFPVFLKFIFDCTSGGDKENYFFLSVKSYFMQAK